MTLLDDVFSNIRPVVKVENNCSEKLSEQFLLMHERKIDSIKELVGKTPNSNEVYFLWTDKSFNAFTFIPYIIKEFGVIDELVISTYSINQRILDSFSRYINMGKISSISLLISETMKFRNPKVADQLSMYANNLKHILKYGYNWNHSKVTLLRTGEHHFVVEGSGNWSENSRNEQYVFLNSENVFNFRKKWIENGII